MGLFGDSGQTTAPWKKAQPYITYGMGQAKNLYQKKSGFNAPGFQTWAPMSAQTQGALGSIWGQAQGGNPLAGQSEAAISGILGGDTAQRYKDLYANADNTHFATAVQNQSDQIANDVQRQFSGLGRVGSAADTGALVDQLGRFREGALSDNWNQNVANQRGILGDMTQGQLGAVGAAPGAYQQRFAPGQAMGQVGAAFDDLRARQLQSRLDAFQTKQQAPWNRLNAYNAAIGGTGGTNGAFSTVKQPSNWLGGALGGALGGGKLAGIPGAIGGGIFGLLSSLG